MKYQPTSTFLPISSVVFVTYLLMTSTLHAAPGDLDPTFGTGGKSIVFFDIGGDLSDFASDVAVLADDKLIVVGGARVSSSNTDIAVVRLNVDGTVDGSFGTGGRVIVPFDLITDGFDSAEAVAVQADGKIIVGGPVRAGASFNDDFGVFRLLANGTLDATFGTGGRVVVALDLGDSNRDYLTDLVVQNDGKIVLAGYSDTAAGDTDFTAVRLLSDGTIDASFGTGGAVTIDFNLGANPNYDALAVALQSDGKIVLAGRTMLGGNNTNMAVARLMPNGSLDSTFSGDGLTDIPFDFVVGGRDVAFDVHIDRDGRILLNGEAEVGIGDDRDFAVARLLTDGTLDASFAGTGRMSVPVAGGLGIDQGRAVGTDCAGKIIVSGSGTTSPGDSDYGLARLTVNGALDSSFGTGGARLVPFDLGDDNSDDNTAQALDSLGRIVLVGFVARSGSGDRDFGIARLIGNGGGCMFGDDFESGDLSAWDFVTP